MSVLRPDNNSTDIEDIVFLYRYISMAFCIILLQNNFTLGKGEDIIPRPLIGDWIVSL